MKNTAQSKGDIVTRNMAKLLLNSLYGKFASNYYDTSTIICKLDEVSDIEKLYDIISITETDSNIVFLTYNTKPVNGKMNNIPDELIRKANHIHTMATEDKNTNIALAATITSHARIILYNLFLEVEKMGGTMIYTDTDSIFASLPESPFNKPFGQFI
jgi:DNA polymerase elongation subunit (family B)